MKRREFITLLGSAVTWPIAVRGQQTPIPVIGYLSNRAANVDSYTLEAFHKGLSETGFLPSQNVAIEYRWAEGRDNRLSELVADLVRRQVTVIATTSVPAALAAKSATATIPIVFTIGEDPVQLGLVQNLNRPVGNITGASFLSAGALVEKRLQILHELLPKVRSVGYLMNPDRPLAESTMRALQAAGHSLGLNVIVLRARSESDFEAVFASLVEQRVEALLVAGDTLFTDRRKQLVVLAAQRAVPTFYQLREFAVDGGLISYSASRPEAHHQAGIYVGRILKGEKPPDLPVLLPTKFELTINTKTAKALGLNIPDKVLALADEVIE